MDPVILVILVKDKATVNAFLLIFVLLDGTTAQEVLDASQQGTCHLFVCALILDIFPEMARASRTPTLMVTQTWQSKDVQKSGVKR